MKKTLLYIGICIALLSLCACGKKEEEDKRGKRTGGGASGGYYADYSGDHYEDEFAYVNSSMNENALVIHETGYINEEARVEVEAVRETVTDSNEWEVYSEYADARYAVDINQFNIRRDGYGGYILDYSGDFNVFITYDNEPEKTVSIYLLDKEREEIANFREIE